MIPNKLQSGQKFKQNTVKTVNAIIDHLKSQRIVGDNATIQVSQGVNGVFLHVPHNGAKAGNGGGRSDFDHPFKLKIVTDEATSANVLTVRSGAIFLTGDDESRIYVEYDQNDLGAPEYVELPQEAGSYLVNLALMYDSQSQDPMNYEWQKRIFYTPSSVYTDDFVNSCGYHTFYLGLLSVTQNEQEQLQYKIQRQFIYSDFAMYDGKIKQPFKARFKVDEYIEDGEVLQQGPFPDKLVINGGIIYCDDEEYTVNQMQFPISAASDEDALYCASIYLLSGSANFVKYEREDYQYYDEKNQMYNIPIASIIGDYSTNSLVGLQQYIDNDIVFGNSIGGKVFLNGDDETPDYLDRKHSFPTVLSSQLSEEQKGIYVSSKQYIKGITINRNEEVESGLIDYYDQLYWDYSAISGYSPSSEFQQLNNVSGQLKWDAAYKVRVNEDDDKPEFLNDKIKPGQFIYTAVDDQNKKLKIWTRGIKEGFNLGYTSGLLNDDPQKPYVQLDGYKTTVTAGNGIKIDTTKKDQGYTLNYKVHSKGQVKIDESDTLGYLGKKISIDNKLSNVIELVNENNKLKIKSKLDSKTGIITVKNGVWNLTQVPDDKSVLAYNKGLKWARIGNGLALKTKNGVLQLVNICCSSSESESSFSVSSSMSVSSSESISISSSNSSSGSESSSSNSISISSSNSLSSSESKSNSSSESKSNSSSESKSNSSSESKSDSSSTSKSNSSSESKSNSSSESKSNSSSSSDSSSTSSSESKSDSSSTSKSNSSSESKSNSSSSSDSSSSSSSSSSTSSSSSSNSSSESKSNSSSDGDPLDCYNKTMTYYVQGTWEINYTGCDGEVWETVRETYNGGPDSTMTIQYISPYYNDSYQDIVSNYVTLADGACRDYGVGQSYIHVCACAPGGYGPYGPYRDIYNYGTYELQPWDRSMDDCIWNEEDGGLMGSKVVVVSVPKIYVVVTQRN